MFKRNIKKTKKKGQSTVEYIILVAAIIGVLILFLADNGPFHRAFNDAMASGTNGMVDMANRLQTSRPTSP